MSDELHSIYGIKKPDGRYLVFDHTYQEYTFEPLSTADSFVHFADKQDALDFAAKMRTTPELWPGHFRDKAFREAIFWEDVQAMPWTDGTVMHGFGISAVSLKIDPATIELGDAIRFKFAPDGGMQHVPAIGQVLSLDFMGPDKPENERFFHVFSMGVRMPVYPQQILAVLKANP